MSYTEDELWYSNILPLTFTNLKVRITNDIGSDYSNLKFVSPNESYTESNYPTIRMALVDMPEVGSDLANTAIEAFRVTLQCDVVSLKATDTERIRNHVIRTMRDLGYRSVSIPPITRDGNKWYGFGRFRRLVEETDITITE